MNNSFTSGGNSKFKTTKKANNTVIYLLCICQRKSYVSKPSLLQNIRKSQLASSLLRNS